MSRALPGARPSPNIWQHTATYEIENRAVDPRRPPRGRDVGRRRLVRPDRARHRLRHRLPPPPLRGDRGLGGRGGAARRPGGAGPSAYPRAGERDRQPGTAQSLPVPDASVDVVHARWAYFFGPGCEPGLAELDRVVRRGGTAFVIDNDPTRSTFGAWFRRGYPTSTRGRRALLVDARLDPDPGRHRVVVLVAGRPGERRPDRVQAGRWPRRSSPSTRAPRSTTRSTSGRRGSEASGTRAK